MKVGVTSQDPAIFVKRETGTANTNKEQKTFERTTEIPISTTEINTQKITAASAGITQRATESLKSTIENNKQRYMIATLSKAHGVTESTKATMNSKSEKSTTILPATKIQNGSKSHEINKKSPKIETEIPYPLNIDMLEAIRKFESNEPVTVKPIHSHDFKYTQRHKLRTAYSTNDYRGKWTVIY